MSNPSIVKDNTHGGDCDHNIDEGNNDENVKQENIQVDQNTLIS